MQIGSILDDDEITAGIVHMQIFIKDLRCPETGAVVSPKNNVLGRVEPYICTRRNNHVPHE